MGYASDASRMKSDATDRKRRKKPTADLEFIIQLTMRVNPYKVPNSPYWQLRYTPAPGQPRVYESTGISHEGRKKPQTVVVEICRAIEERLAKAKFGISPGIVSKSIKEFAGEYIASLSGMAATTISSRRMHLGLWSRWCEAQGVKMMSEITNEHAIRYVDHLRANCALTTTSTRVNTLRGAMTEAKRRGYILIDNPFTMIIHNAQAKARDAWTLEEIHALLAIEKPAWLKTAIRVSLYTGTRSGSINTMVWQDIDFERHVVDFRSKTGEYSVALHPELERYCLTLWETVKPRPQTPLVPELVGKPSSYLADVFGTARLKAGVKRGTFHWFRHLMPAALNAQGVPMDVRMKILNHKSEATHRHYLHVDAAKSLEYISRVKFE